MSSQRIQGEMSLRNIGQGVSNDPSAPETCMSYGFLMPVEEDFRQQYEGQMQYDAWEQFLYEALGSPGFCIAGPLKDPWKRSKVGKKSQCKEEKAVH